ncbi:SAM-dependent methyltransferase [Undibacter mobilis]|uniref:site-specific DNA-methyltransferase (adenine-specific) n=2 Tax=Undibacter mobilis TaxID=2292256 RepID=A0A371B3D2_9BRAD|nr:SAM-dependent methyltransferase [Undibacter mobilis]
MSSATQRIDVLRREATEQLDPVRRVAMGQFMTPSPIADFMASLFRKWPAEARLLDAGAGIGSLTRAFVQRFSSAGQRGSRLSIAAYEIEPVLLPYLRDQLAELQGPSVTASVVERDFLREAAFALSFGDTQFTHVILNPPYKKIGATSDYRLLLRQAGIEAVNLYVAFLGLAVALTRPGGEIVAIIPRSFCNGTYFRPFRRWLLKEAAITHIHVFDSRKKAFHDDDVLQENVIIRLERKAHQGEVVISTSHGPTFSDYAERSIPFSDVVKPGDEQCYIHIPTFTLADAGHLFVRSLSDLGLGVATGPVVDFRLREYWRAQATESEVPLLYSHHFKGGKLTWPREHKKPNALKVSHATQKWLMPAGWYAVTKRFSSKEERRRLVAFVVDPGLLPFPFFGFENHLNVIHSEKRGVDPILAHGIALFLNATITDQYFRNFSGHTQVNATDLRTMLYPERQTLLEYGKWAVTHGEATQDQVDAVVEGTDVKVERSVGNSDRS